MREIWQSLIRRPILSISAPFVVVLGIRSLIKTGSEWIEVFVGAARIFLAGGDIYGAGSAYFYPPFMALLCVPFVTLPDAASRLLYFALNLACIFGLVRSAWSLSGGATLTPISPETRREWGIAGIGILCSESYFLNALAHTQVDIFIDFFVVAGSLSLVRGHKVGGALLIGLAAAFKGPPLLFSAYLIFRRNWLAAALIVLVAITLNLLPDLIVPAPDGQLRLMVWLQRFVIGTLGGRLGSWDAMSIFNQSLAGALGRLFTTTFHFTASGPVYVRDVGQASDLLAKIFAYGLMLVLLAASIVAALRGQTSARVGTPRRPSLTALELSAVSLLMLLMSPMSHLTHLPVLILPGFCLARIAVLTRDRVIITTLIVAVVSALAENKDPIGNTLYTFVLWSGVATWGMLMLLAGCITAMARGYCEPPAAALSESILRPAARPSPAQL